MYMCDRRMWLLRQCVHWETGRTGLWNNQLQQENCFFWGDIHVHVHVYEAVYIFSLVDYMMSRALWFTLCTTGLVMHIPCWWEIHLYIYNRAGLSGPTFPICIVHVHVCVLNSPFATMHVHVRVQCTHVHVHDVNKHTCTNSQHFSKTFCPQFTTLGMEKS